MNIIERLETINESIDKLYDALNILHQDVAKLMGFNGKMPDFIEFYNECPRKVQYALQARNCKSMEDILEINEYRWSITECVGSVTMRELKKELARHGLSLKVR